MANTFTSYTAKNVTTSASTLVTVAAGTQTTIIGATICNTSGAAITVNLYFTRSAVDNYIVYNASVPVGRTFVAIGGDQKVVLIAGDALKVISSAVTSADAVVSVLNIT
jgi:hypothetical protein